MGSRWGLDVQMSAARFPKFRLTRLSALAYGQPMSHRNTSALTESALLAAGGVVALRGLVLVLVLVLLITSGGAG